MIMTAYHMNLVGKIQVKLINRTHRIKTHVKKKEKKGGRKGGR